MFSVCAQNQIRAHARYAHAQHVRARNSACPPPPELTDLNGRTQQPPACHAHPGGGRGEAAPPPEDSIQQPPACSDHRNWSTSMGARNSLRPATPTEPHLGLRTPSGSPSGLRTPSGHPFGAPDPLRVTPGLSGPDPLRNAIQLASWEVRNRT